MASKDLWNDEDDEEVQLSSRYLKRLAPDITTKKDLEKRQKLDGFNNELRQRYAERAGIVSKPQWLQKFEEEKEAKEEDVSEDSDDEDATTALHGMSRTAAKYLSKSKSLPRMYLKSSRVPDITKAHAHEGKLGALKFHPTQPVLLLGSNNGISLFQACQSTEDLQQKRGDAFLQNVKFKKFPIDYMGFYDDATSIIATSKKSFHYYTYNMLSGQVAQNIYPRIINEVAAKKQKNRLVRLSADGELIAIISNSVEVYVFVLKTMEHVHTFMANSEISDVCFSPTDQKKIYALTVTGACHIWDLRETGCQKIFQDEGSFHGTKLSISPSEQFLACAANTGIVNVYESSTLQVKANPKPAYTLENLTTYVDFLKFNHNSEMLSFGSSDKAMAFRIMHTQSGTVFKNFPPPHEMLGKEYFTCTDISPHSGFAAFGNTNGGVRIYRLNHYESY